MAEFGELLPGTEWRTANGKRAVVKATIVTAGVFEPDGREMSNASWSFTERDVAGWGPWVEPIAVGDRVRYITESSLIYTVLALDDDVAWCRAGGSRFTFFAKNLRKVTGDE